jgi:hypothetical protein
MAHLVVRAKPWQEGGLALGVGTEVTLDGKHYDFTALKVFISSDDIVRAQFTVELESLEMDIEDPMVVIADDPQWSDRRVEAIRRDAIRNA